MTNSERDGNKKVTGPERGEEDDKEGIKSTIVMSTQTHWNAALETVGRNIFNVPPFLLQKSLKLKVLFSTE